MKYFFIAFGFFVLSFSAMAQEQGEDDPLLQLSGAVLTGDSLRPVPYTHVVNITQGTGTISNFQGYFSIVVEANDTILFSNIGYRNSVYILPDSLPDTYYTLIQMLEPDTIFLPEVVVLPWRTVEQFKQAVINVQLPEDDLQRARRNLALLTLKEMAMNIEDDPGLSSDLAIRNQQSYLYNAGMYTGSGQQAVVGALSNPFAWAKFIQAWKNGELGK